MLPLRGHVDRAPRMNVLVVLVSLCLAHLRRTDAEISSRFDNKRRWRDSLASLLCCHNSPASTSSLSSAAAIASKKEPALTVAPSSSFFIFLCLLHLLHPGAAVNDLLTTQQSTSSLSWLFCKRNPSSTHRNPRLPLAAIATTQRIPSSLISLHRRHIRSDFFPPSARPRPLSSIAGTVTSHLHGHFDVHSSPCYELLTTRGFSSSIEECPVTTFTTRTEPCRSVPFPHFSLSPLHHLTTSLPLHHPHHTLIILSVCNTPLLSTSPSNLSSSSSWRSNFSVPTPLPSSLICPSLLAAPSASRLPST